ncbi:MAG: hypothetical protein U5K34_10125 [Thiohalophilus sp.]|nr:hypothetical protein [Thiohalophilus sp.]MDZ7804323.1 hypothetical protein [Thiohalophilus sp.]
MRTRHSPSRAVVRTGTRCAEEKKNAGDLAHATFAPALEFGLDFLVAVGVELAAIVAALHLQGKADRPDDVCLAQRQEAARQIAVLLDLASANSQNGELAFQFQVEIAAAADPVSSEAILLGGFVGTNQTMERPPSVSPRCGPWFVAPERSRRGI